MKLEQLNESLSGYFYHGTPTEENAKSILSTGYLRPGHDGSRKENNLTPMLGRTYFTKDLSYAIIYMLGGDMAGHMCPKTILAESQYGYLFMIDGSKIESALPDEDVVGEVIYYIYNRRRTDKYNLHAVDFDAIDSFIDDNQDEIFGDHNWSPDDGDEYADTGRTPWMRFNNAEYDTFAKVGKYALKNMDAELLASFSEISPHMSAGGNIPILKAWKFNKEKSSILNRDGSNFFQLAERVK